jgi:tetratricopeptide (TPR) repeat protein
MAKSVFISSTSLDLKKYRKAAIEVCKTLGFEPIAMEDFEAMGVGATEGSKRKLKEADLFVGIVAHRYGYVEAGHEVSVTESEFDYAGERGLDRLCFIVEPGYGWPKRWTEKRNAERVVAFKAKIEKSVIRNLFTTVDDFRNKLTMALVNWQEWRSARSGELDAIFATHPDDVPGNPERLVGRDALVADIHGLLDKGKRVLLQGFGGMGKTALAAHVAAERIAAGKGAVVWLRAGTEDRDGLLVALARPFDAQQTVIKESGIANQARVVRLLLAEQEVRLIVLDDVWNARALTQLLNVNAVPSGVPILVTSRSRFTGLTRLDVGRLERRASLELLAHYGDEAWIKDKDANALCEKLGDHTYAVKVAALTLALDGLSPRQLLERIAAAPWKLTAPEGAEEEGRTSVEELLTTSLYGLDAEARGLFLAFGAFFSSSATPEMLGSYLGITTAAIEDALNRLQRRGLAERVIESDERAVEYRIHDLAYSYVRAQASNDDHHRALDACLHYLERYREAKPENFSALRTELDNFIGAAGWAMSVERYTDVQRFANWLYRNFDTDTAEGFLHLQGYASVATTLLEQAATASELLKDVAGQAAYLGSLGSAYRDLGQIKNGMKYYRQALKLYRDLGDVAGEGLTLGRIGIAHRLLGQAQSAIEHLEQALAIARQFDNKQAEGINLANLGIAYRLIGQLDKAIEHLEQALTMAQARGDKRGEAINLGNIGDIYREQEKLAQAIATYELALALVREMGDRRGGGINLGRLGDAYRGLGQYARAAEYLSQALAIARETGDKRGEAINLGRLGDTYRDQGQLETAVQHHERGLNIARQMDDKRGEGYSLADLAIDYMEQKEHAKALEHFQQARVIFDGLGMQHRVVYIDQCIEETERATAGM